MEQFSIPGTGGIIVKNTNKESFILLQKRSKSGAPREEGLLEIPAGKIRAFENIFDTLKREVKEETGLDIVEILGEDGSTVYQGNSYRVLNFTPFSCAQNLQGEYPIMVFVFICRAEGDLLASSDESRDYRWTPAGEIAGMLNSSPELFYPMHVDTLKKYLARFPD